MLVIRSLKNQQVQSYATFQALSMCGTSMVQTLLPWFLIDAGSDVALLAWVANAYLVPAVLLNPFAGVLADRHGPRRVLLATQSLNLVYNLVLALLIACGAWSPLFIVVACWAMGLVTVIDNNARHSFVKAFGQEHLFAMVSINSTIINISRVVGPALGAWLYGSLGFAACLVVNALSYVGIIHNLLGTPPDRPRAPLPIALDGLLRGFRVLWGTNLRFVMLLAIVSSFTTYMFLSIIPLLVKYTYAGDERTLAAVNVALAVGSIAGALTVGFHADLARTLRRVVLHILGMGGCVALLALVPAPHEALTYGLLVLIGYAMTHIYPTYTSTIHAHVEDAVRARSMSAYASSHLALTPVATFLSIWLFEHVSSRAALLTCAALCCVSVGVLVVHARARGPIAVVNP